MNFFVLPFELYKPIPSPEFPTMSFLAFLWQTSLLYLFQILVFKSPCKMRRSHTVIYCHTWRLRSKYHSVWLTKWATHDLLSRLFSITNSSVVQQYFCCRAPADFCCRYCYSVCLRNRVIGQKSGDHQLCVLI